MHDIAAVRKEFEKSGPRPYPQLGSTVTPNAIKTLRLPLAGTGQNVNLPFKERIQVPVKTPVNPVPKIISDQKVITQPTTKIPGKVPNVSDFKVNPNPQPTQPRPVTPVNPTPKVVPDQKLVPPPTPKIPGKVFQTPERKTSSYNPGTQSQNKVAPTPSRSLPPVTVTPPQSFQLPKVVQQLPRPVAPAMPNTIRVPSVPQQPKLTPPTSFQPPVRQVIPSRSPVLGPTFTPRTPPVSQPRFTPSTPRVIHQAPASHGRGGGSSGKGHLK